MLSIKQPLVAKEKCVLPVWLVNGRPKNFLAITLVASKFLWLLVV